MTLEFYSKLPRHTAWQKLTFIPHNEYIICKANRGLGCIKTILMKFETSMSVCWYGALLEYESIIWFTFYKIYVDRIESGSQYLFGVKYLLISGTPRKSKFAIK